MQQVTTKKFAELCGVSDANIRGMIARGSLVAVKDIQGNNLLDIEDEKNRSYLDLKRNPTQSQTQFVSNATQDLTQGNNGISETLAQYIAELAQKAGKAEQIENNLIERQKDVDYWREKYFSSQSDNTELQKSDAILRNQLENKDNEINALKKQIEDLQKKKNWFGWRAK